MKPIFKNLKQVNTQFLDNRSSGRSAPFLLAPAEGWGALRAPNSPLGCSRAFGPLFITIKLYFESEFPFWGGAVCFIKKNLFVASLYMFLIFWNFRGSFLFDFCFLKISKLSFESVFPLLVGYVL